MSVETAKTVLSAAAEEGKASRLDGIVPDPKVGASAPGGKSAQVIDYDAIYQRRNAR